MKFVKENCINCKICLDTPYVKVGDDGNKIIKDNLTIDQRNELKTICPTGAFED